MPYLNLSHFIEIISQTSMKYFIYLCNRIKYE